MAEQKHLLFDPLGWSFPQDIWVDLNPCIDIQAVSLLLVVYILSTLSSCSADVLSLYILKQACALYTYPERIQWPFTKMFPERCRKLPRDVIRKPAFARRNRVKDSELTIITVSRKSSIRRSSLHHWTQTLHKLASSTSRSVSWGVLPIPTR